MSAVSRLERALADAALICQLAASNCVGSHVCSWALGLDPNGLAGLLAATAFRYVQDRSTDHGWAEDMAEAECLLRGGWLP